MRLKSEKHPWNRRARYNWDCACRNFMRFAIGFGILATVLNMTLLHYRLPIPSSILTESVSSASVGNSNTPPHDINSHPHRTTAYSAMRDIFRNRILNMNTSVANYTYSRSENSSIPPDPCFHGLIVNHEPLDHVQWADTVSETVHTSVSLVQSLIELEIREDAFDFLNTSLTVIVRMGTSKLVSWRDCLPKLLSLPCSSIVSRVVLVMWNESSPLPPTSEFSPKIDVVRPSREGIGYRFHFPRGFFDSQFVMSLDDDMCVSHCSDLLRAARYLKKNPESSLGGDAFSQGLYRESPACSNLIYQGRRKGDSFYLASNSIASRVYYDAYASVFPDKILAELSRIKNCEDLCFSWFLAVMRPTQAQFDAHDTDFSADERFLPAPHFHQDRVSCHKDPDRLSCRAKSRDQRSACLNMLLSLYGQLEMYPRVPRRFVGNNI